MHAILTNQIVDIWRFSNNYLVSQSVESNVGNVFRVSDVLQLTFIL